MSTSLMRELYTGYKQTKWAQSFALIFIIRRVLFAIFIAFFNDRTFAVETIMATIAGIQALYFVILVTVRPYETLKDNILEVVNEFIFGVCAALMVYFRDDSKWNEEVEWVIYVIIMVAINFYYLLGIFFFIYGLCTRQKEETIKVEPSVAHSRSSAEDDKPISHDQKSTGMNRGNTPNIFLPARPMEDHTEADKAYLQEQRTDRGNEDNSMKKIFSYQQLAKERVFGSE